MPIVVPIFAVAFNALLWLTRIALSPIVGLRLGATAGWLVALISPLALLLLAIRVEHRRRNAFVFVAAGSLAMAGLLAGS
jgi:hypothetical protein